MFWELPDRESLDHTAKFAFGSYSFPCFFSVIPKVCFCGFWYNPTLLILLQTNCLSWYLGTFLYTLSHNTGVLITKMENVKEPDKKIKTQLVSIITDSTFQVETLIPVSEERKKKYTQAPTQVTVNDTLPHSFVLYDLGLCHTALVLPGANVHHLLLIFGLKK